MAPQKDVGTASTIILTGSAEHVDAVTETLTRSGVGRDDLVGVTDLSRLTSTCERLAPRTVRAYVQLPVTITSDAPTVTGRFRDFLTGGIVARFDAAATVLPTLADDAVIVLVGGNTPAAGTPADDRHARASLLRVLRWGLLADRPQASTKVVLTTSTAGAEEICALALSGPPPKEQRIAALDVDNPEMSYDDWRLAVLSLASVDA